MIQQIVLDKTPYEEFLLNFSKLVSESNEKNLIFLDFDFCKYASEFYKSNTNLLLHSDITSNISNFSEIDNLPISLRVTDPKRNSWFFELKSISEKYAILTHFSYLALDINYIPPKDTNLIQKAYYITIRC